MHVLVYRCIVIPENWYTRIAWYRCAVVPVYQCTCVPVYLCTCTSVSVYRCTSVPVYRCTSVWAYRCTMSQNRKRFTHIVFDLRFPPHQQKQNCSQKDRNNHTKSTSRSPGSSATLCFGCRFRSMMSLVLTLQNRRRTSGTNSSPSSSKGFEILSKLF